MATLPDPPQPSDERAYMERSHFYDVIVVPLLVFLLGVAFGYVLHAALSNL